MMTKILVCTTAVIFHLLRFSPSRTLITCNFHIKASCDPWQMILPTKLIPTEHHNACLVIIMLVLVFYDHWQNRDDDHVSSSNYYLWCCPLHGEAGFLLDHSTEALSSLQSSVLCQLPICEWGIGSHRKDLNQHVSFPGDSFASALHSCCCHIVPQVPIFLFFCLDQLWTVK